MAPGGPADMLKTMQSWLIQAFAFQPASNIHLKCDIVVHLLVLLSCCCQPASSIHSKCDTVIYLHAVVGAFLDAGSWENRLGAEAGSDGSQNACGGGSGS